MIGLQLKQLWKSKGLVIGLLTLFILSILSIYTGKVFIDSQEQIVELSAQVQSEHVERNIEYGHGHVGLFLYYIKFGFANESSPIAGLSIGQRDMKQAAQLINIRNLEEQKHSSEFLNPYFQLLGNLDFSFVIIYVFPLIIIALSFDLWSEEKECVRWSLIAVQSPYPRSVLLLKLLLRLGSIILLFGFLSIVAVQCLNLSVDFTLVTFGSLSLLYICFWFSLSWWVISLDKSSKQNAIILLSLWLILTTIIPVITLGSFNRCRIMKLQYWN